MMKPFTVIVGIRSYNGENDVQFGHAVYQVNAINASEAMFGAVGDVIGGKNLECAPLAAFAGHHADLWVEHAENYAQKLQDFRAKKAGLK